MYAVIESTMKQRRNYLRDFMLNKSHQQTVMPIAGVVLTGRSSTWDSDNIDLRETYPISVYLEDGYLKFMSDLLHSWVNLFNMRLVWNTLPDCIAKDFYGDLGNPYIYAVQWQRVLEHQEYTMNGRNDRALCNKSYQEGSTHHAKTPIQGLIGELVNTVCRMKAIVNRGILIGILQLNETMALLQNMRTFEMHQTSEPVMGVVAIATGHLQVANSSTVSQIFGRKNKSLKPMYRNINLVTPTAGHNGDGGTNAFAILDETGIRNMHSFLLSESTNTRLLGFTVILLDFVGLNAKSLEQTSYYPIMNGFCKWLMSEIFPEINEPFVVGTDRTYPMNDVKCGNIFKALNSLAAMEGRPEWGTSVAMTFIDYYLDIQNL